MAEYRGLWERAEREHAYWQAHGPDLAARYVGQFVAVHDGEVIANAYDLRDLIALIESRGLRITETWVHYFPDPQIPWVLAIYPSARANASSAARKSSRPTAPYESCTSPLREWPRMAMRTARSIPIDRIVPLA